MQTSATLFEARWIVPVEPAGVVLDNHSMVVSGGRIVALLPTADARTSYPDAERVQLLHHLLVPGLVNAHTHAAMTLLRGYADDLPLETWLKEHIWPAERRWVSPEFVRDGAALGIAEMIRGGVTCFADQYFFPEQVADIAHQARIRCRLGMVVIDFPTAYADGPDEYLDLGLAMHDRWKSDALISTMFAPHATYTVSTPVLERIAGLSAELDLPVKIHLHETTTEVHQAQAATGMRPLAMLERVGLVNPGLIAVHMTQIEAEEMTLLAECGANVVHCPQSNMKLASGSCPVHALLNAGVNVALGTDGAASNNDLDLIDEMRTAALLAKLVAQNAAALPAHAALRMATLSGASALGLSEETGSLEPGKSADFIAVDLSALESQPTFDPVSALVYATGRHQVTDSWVAGHALMRERRLMTLDAGRIVERAKAWQGRMR